MANSPPDPQIREGRHQRLQKEEAFLSRPTKLLMIEASTYCISHKSHNKYQILHNSLLYQR
eukprot:458491-Ditylum_brightwellii.AAC.1